MMGRYSGRIVVYDNEGTVKVLLNHIDKKKHVK